MSTLVVSVPNQRPANLEIITGNNAAFACCDYGEGEPVVALHCSASSGRQWRPLAEGLGDGFRVLAPDGFGCGDSLPWSGARAFRLTEEATMVRALAAQSGRPVHLVGHSYGDGVALRAALEMPELIRSLTLIEPSAFHLLRVAGAAEEDLFAEVRTIAGLVAAAVLSGNYTGGMAKFIDYWSQPGAWQSLDPLKQRSFAAKAPRVALDFTALIEENVYRNAYRRLDMPVLLLEGNRSPKPARRICRLLAEILPRATLVTIPGLGHMGVIDALERYLPAIRGHLAGATATEPMPFPLAASA